MKITNYVLLMIPFLGFSQQKENQEPPVFGKNEIRTSLIVNGGGPNIGFDYERALSSKFGLGVFYKKNLTNIHIEEEYAREDVGFGIKSRYYLNEYRTPTYLKYYPNNYGIKIKHFLEFAIEQVEVEWFETNRNINDNNVFVIERDKIEESTTTLHFGLGTKFTFPSHLTVQGGLGYSRYLISKEDLEHNLYLNISVGYIF